MLLAALINILGLDNRGDRPKEVLLMAAYGEREVLDHPNMRVMRWRNGALSGSDLANEPGLGSSRTYQPGELPLPTKPRPGLRRMHQEVNSEASSSGSQQRAAVPPKRARVEEEVQTNETMQDPNGTIEELEKTRRELDKTRTGVTDTALPTRSSRVPDRKIREMPMKIVSRVIDVQKNNQLKYSFTGVPDTDSRACFNRSTWKPAVNLQQPPLGTSKLILGDSLVRVLLDHYGDGLWRCNDSPAISDGGADEPREDP